MTEFTKTFRRTTYPTIAPSSPANDQAGRTILVVGASEGIGIGIAKAFAAANASKLILVSRTQGRLSDASETIKREHANVEIETRKSTPSSTSSFYQLVQCSHQRLLEQQVAMINFNMIANLHSFERFRTQPNPARRPSCLLYLSSAGLHLYPYDMVPYAASKGGFSNYLCHAADFVPENEMRIIVLHPGAVYTPAAGKAGEVSADLHIWDDPSLSAHMAVWLAGQDSGFLHGRFLWANWDADELIGRKEQILEDPALLKVGITGVESFSIKDLMDVCNKFPVPKQ